MNKYAVALYSIVDNATVWIQFLVNTEMTSRQLRIYYLCKSITISNVEVEQL